MRFGGDWTPLAHQLRTWRLMPRVEYFGHFFGALGFPEELFERPYLFYGVDPFNFPPANGEAKAAETLSWTLICGISRLRMASAMPGWRRRRWWGGCCLLREKPRWLRADNMGGWFPKIGGCENPKMDGENITENSLFLNGWFWGDFTHHLRKHPYGCWIFEFKPIYHAKVGPKN